MVKAILKLISRGLVTAALACSATGLAQTYTNITATGVQNGFGAPLPAGAICFSPYNSSASLTPITPSGGSPSTGPFCGTVVNGVVNLLSTVPNLSTASPAGLNYQVTVYDQAANVVTQLFGVTAVVGTSWSYSSYTVLPALLPNLPAMSGVGSPYLLCSVAANYTRTDITPMQNWACATTPSGYTQWASNGTIPPVPGPNQQATIPVVLQMINDALSHFSPGGGGAPGTPQFSIQYNSGPTTFGGSQSSTDATGKQMNTPILNGAYDAFKNQTNPTSNDGIARAQAAAGTNGVTVAGPNYPMVELAVPAFPNASGTYEDKRMGRSYHVATNPEVGTGNNNVTVHAFDCYFDYNATPAATDASNCQNHSELYAGIGNDAGGGVTTVGGSARTSVKVRNGILAVGEETIDCWADGDCHAARYTFSTQGLNSDPSQEGYGAFMPHFIQVPLVLVSHVNTVTDSTHIKTDLPPANGSYGTFMGGGWLIKQASIDSGNITADSPASGGIVNRRFTTSTAHPVSTAWGATTTILNPPANFVNGDATSVTVTKLGGTWPASGNVCISGDHTYETTFTGATNGATVTMTIQSRYEEPVGSTIVVGSCTEMFSNVDRVLNSQNGLISSEIAVDIIGAPDANTYFYTLGMATRDGGTMNGSYNWTTDQTMGLVAGGNVTRDASNNVAFASDSGNTGLGYKFMGTRTIAVTGCANSSFNFGPTSITITPNGNPFLLQYVQPGAIAGAASTTGCTISMTGLNGFTLHKAAKVISASDPTIPKSQFPFTGYYQLGTNTAAFSPGDAVEQPNGNSIPIDQFSEVAGQTPTLGGKPAIPLVDWLCRTNGFSGAGQCSGGLTPIRINNQAPWSQYIGGGGLYQPMQMANISGVWGGYWNIGSAPANGGTYVTFGCPPEGCASPVPYSLFKLGGTFNSSLTYVPGTGQFSINAQSLFTSIANFNQSTSFSYSILNGAAGGPGLKVSFVNGSPQYGCITFINNCTTTSPDNAAIFGDATQVDKTMPIQFLHNGHLQFRAWSGSGFAFNNPCNLYETTFDCSTAVAGTTGARGLFTIVGSGLPGNTDFVGELAVAAATTSTYTFTGTYAIHPECFVQEQATTATSGRPWVTYTGVTSFTVNFTAAFTGNVSYTCHVRN